MLNPPVAARRAKAVDAQNDALTTKSGGKLGDQIGPFKRGRINADLVRARTKTARGSLDIADAAGDRERDVDHGRDSADPVGVEAAAIGAGDYVVEHELIGALVAITQRMVDDIANVPMIAEPDALDDPAIGDVEARDDPSRGHKRSLARR